MSERLLRGLSLVALFVFLCISWYVYEPSQWPAPLSWQALLGTAHSCGPLGLLAAHLMVAFVGRTLSVLIPVALVLLGYAALRKWNRRQTLRYQMRILGVTLLGAAVAELAAGPGAGGALGRLELEFLGALLGRIGTTILLASIGGLMLLRLMMPLARPVLSHSDFMRTQIQGAGQLSRDLWQRLVEDVRSFLHPTSVDEDHPSRKTSGPRTAHVRQNELSETPAPERLPERGTSLTGASQAPRIRDLRRTPRPRVVEGPGLPEEDRDSPRIRTQRDTNYRLPGYELLNEPQLLTSESITDAELVRQSRTLEEKLADFGIGGRVAEVQPGPVITTYEFEPAPGIKVSQVTSRVDDLAMALRARAIRMVAPIPGKAAIGIEIPNNDAQVVAMREIMQAWTKDLNVGPLGLALGKTVSGEPFFADLASMPHLLVAGATGSGKSVCINVLLCSLLLRHNPNEVKLLLIDPKMLELNAYRDIPHLLHPVVTEPKDAYKALHWMTLEMERRYRELAKASVRNILGYNKKVRAGEVRDDDGQKKEALPYVVVIVDELADLMIQVGGEIETPIARLAQMARAVGIHLVLATQRPSVDVITGVIKANFPSRIAFQVSSRVDSRTILDTNGAEMLLGRGDMLFLAGGRPHPIRLHGAFVSVEECERIADHWRSFGQNPGRLDLDEPRNSSSGDPSADDDLFDAARRLVVASGVGSVSYLQRRLKVGYSRAARIMDMLEEAGVVGPALGSKPRDILESPEDLAEPIE